MRCFALLLCLLPFAFSYTPSAKEENLINFILSMYEFSHESTHGSEQEIEITIEISLIAINVSLSSEEREDKIVWTILSAHPFFDRNGIEATANQMISTAEDLTKGISNERMESLGVGLKWAMDEKFFPNSIEERKRIVYDVVEWNENVKKNTVYVKEFDEIKVLNS